MKDRVPTKPNRYAVYDDAHNFLRYEYHERADEPTQVGSAINKANLLPDDVVAALGLTGDPQVKDALNKIKALIDTAQNTANGRARIETGSYTGNGATGTDIVNIATNGTPVCILIWGRYPASSFFISFKPMDAFSGSDVSSANVETHNPVNVQAASVTWGVNAIKWSSGGTASYAFNDSGRVYHYVIFEI